jgi:excisionase family DNA binding protein
MEPRHASSDEERLSIGEAARFAGVSVDTLRRWSNEDRLPSIRTPGGQRRFCVSDLRKLLETGGEPETVEATT